MSARLRFFGALHASGDKTPCDTGADSTRVVEGGGNVDGGALGEGFLQPPDLLLVVRTHRATSYEVFAVFERRGMVGLLATLAWASQSR